VIRRLLLAATLALVGLLAPAAPASAGERAGTFIVLTDAGRLVHHNVADLSVTHEVAVTGVGAGESLLGIDVRPATGQLYAVSSGSRLYVIDPISGAATAIGSGPFTPPVVGSTVGFDFNPTVDRIRLITDTEQNLRLHPDTGAVAAVDRNLAPGGEVAAAAYTNSFAAATSTTLFDIDTERDVLVSQVPPNDGTLNTIGTLGVDATGVNGFDIAPGNTPYAALTVGGRTQLYRVDLTSGRASALGDVGSGARVVGLAVFPLVDRGYFLLAGDGRVTPVGDAGQQGELVAPSAGIAATPSGDGYWTLARSGQVANYGDATHFGDLQGVRLNQPLVGIATTPSGRGYWLAAADGGVFAFGDANFFGSTGDITLNQPVVGIAATPTGRGYWLVARDGGVFAFGDANFFGSTGDITLNQPVVGVAAMPTGRGYWLVAADGGVFTFGNAGFFGSGADRRQPAPAVAITRTARGNGYWITLRNGTVLPFGAAPALGGAARPANASPIVGMAAS
jgi:hypothetical protein